MEFYCQEKRCPYEGNEPYRVTIPTEACMDEHNLATLFCPYCNQALTGKKRTEPIATNH